MTNVMASACPSCGAPNQDTRFCESCGNRLREDPAPVPFITAKGPLTSVARYRIATLVGVAALAVVSGVGVSIAYQVGDFSLIGPRIFGVLLVLATSAAGFWSATFNFDASNRRTAAVLLVVIPGAIAALCVGVSPTFLWLEWVFEICLFASWAVTARFRGFGYFGLLVGVVVSVIGGLITGGLVSLAYQTGGGGGVVVFSDFISLVAQLAVVAATVGSALAFERWQAKRPLPAPRPAYYAPGGIASPSTPGSPAPMPYGAYPAGYGFATDRTNTLAVVSLVLGLLSFTLLAIIFGHVALSQIKRTGERGRGMAVAGAVLGYAWTGIVLIYLLVIFGLVASAFHPIY
jgi:Domain of unknown function (DUF4190)